MGTHEGVGGGGGIDPRKWRNTYPTRADQTVSVSFELGCSWDVLGCFLSHVFGSRLLLLVWLANLHRCTYSRGGHALVDMKELTADF